MHPVWLLCLLALWLAVLFLGFLLLGALRAVALLRWRVAQLEATTPSRLGRGGLPPGRKAPEFCLPGASGGEVSLRDYARRQLLLVFMQPGCGPCHRLTPELNRLHDAGEVAVLVVQNADFQSVQAWIQDTRPRFPVALQAGFSLSKRYQVFATPFAFLIDERGVIAARGIASTKQYLCFVLTQAGQEDREDHGESEAPGASPGSPAPVGEPSLPSTKEVDHV
jgi:methylamine dehydrogenase accessory protein MauD